VGKVASVKPMKTLQRSTTRSGVSQGTKVSGRGVEPGVWAIPGDVSGPTVIDAGELEAQMSDPRVREMHERADRFMDELKATGRISWS